MDGSGVVFGVIVAIWAACLLPQWLQRRDELSGSRAGDRFSEGVRVLTRRVGAVTKASVESAATSSPTRAVVGTTAGSTAGSTEPHPRLVATPMVPAPRPLVLPNPATSARTVPAAAERPRSAAALAAARRRHILMTLAVLAVAGIAVAPMPTVPTWIAAAAAAPLLGFLTLLLATAPLRRHSSAARPVARHAAPAPAVAPTRRVVDLRDGAQPRAFDEVAEAPEEVEGTDLADRRAADRSVADRSVADRTLDVSALDLAAAAGIATDPSLWQPIPVPRPTYTMKPAARRSTVQPYRTPEEVPMPRGAGVDRDRTDLDDVLDRRRASGQ